MECRQSNTYKSNAKKKFFNLKKMKKKRQLLALKMQENNYSKEKLYKKYNITSRTQLTEEQIDEEIYLLDNDISWLTFFEICLN